ncbi:hypothetical protein Osc7112_0436 [Oscillatoria nigro-viridis PCC 7112]|uniref:Uncharacterized protein n=1 Tax=Phormidium nigroviride PCC 7112 TaxID=179408 RepID=K9VC35_9CYAN|nr:hypothetical protein [Oscillatoria nigro-viridis]AFZ05044.1 hypothetical protein Osc7112_0436 [Oscillatoria nigro-viridis PCC 7112]
MKDSTALKKGKNILIIIAVNLAIAFICLEALSLAFYFINQKQFFYTRTKTKEKVVEDIERVGIRLDESIVERLHPLFGYVLKQGAFTNEKLKLKVNKEGFFSLYEYPFIKTNKNQVIIGVFGGSVANNFAVDEYVTRRLSNKLKTYPEFANKEIIVLNFGNGGYKQPQQLLILNYFLALGQELDLVINIDGFNEVALSNLNNKAQVEIGMPSVQHIQPLTGLANNNLSPDAMRSIVQINETKKQLKAGIDKLQTCQLALCHAVTSLQVKQLVNNYQQAVVKYDRQIKQSNPNTANSGIVYIPKADFVLQDAAAFDKMASMWYQSSIGMNQILSSRKIKYFHFIQPNQYYPTKRAFTAKENEIAIDQKSPYIEGVKKGYPVLLSKVDDLQKAGVNVFSAVNILDNTKETVYKDACCHYNSVGDEVLANYVSSSIIKVVRESK